MEELLSQSEQRIYDELIDQLEPFVEQEVKAMETRLTEVIRNECRSAVRAIEKVTLDEEVVLAMANVLGEEAIKASRREITQLRSKLRKEVGNDLMRLLKKKYGESRFAGMAREALRHQRQAL